MRATLCMCDDSQDCVLYVIVHNSKVLWGDLHCVAISAVCAWLLYAFAFTNAYLLCKNSRQGRLNMCVSKGVCLLMCSPYLHIINGKLTNYGL